MANAFYPKYKEAVLTGSSNISVTTGTVKVALINTSTYTYSSTHQFYSDLTGVVGTPQTIASITDTSGTVKGNNVTFTALSGSTVGALVIYIDTGTTTTSRLIAYIDTSVTGLPLTPNGGDVTITWNASGIVAL